MRFEAAYRAGIGSSSIHRPQRTGFVSDPAAQLVLGCWMEGGLEQGGVLQEALALLLGVKPVSSGTS